MSPHKETNWYVDAILLSNKVLIDAGIGNIVFQKIHRLFGHTKYHHSKKTLPDHWKIPQTLMKCFHSRSLGPGIFVRKSVTSSARMEILAKDPTMRFLKWSGWAEVTWQQWDELRWWVYDENNGGGKKRWKIIRRVLRVLIQLAWWGCAVEFVFHLFQYSKRNVHAISFAYRYTYTCNTIRIYPICDPWDWNIYLQWSHKFEPFMDW